MLVGITPNDSLNNGEMETTVTKKGQITVPAAVRARLGLKPKDKVVFEIEGKEIKIRRAVSKIARWYGSVIPIGKPEDFGKLRQEFEQGVAKEVRAEDRG